MKYISLMLMLFSSASFAGPVFLNITSEQLNVPAMSIPTPNFDQCGNLMRKLAKEPGTNFYLSCSSFPLPDNK